MTGVRVANVPLFRYHKPPLFFLGCPSFKAPEPSEAAEVSEESACASHTQQQPLPLPVPDTRASRSACFFFFFNINVPPPACRLATKTFRAVYDWTAEVSFIKP